MRVATANKPYPSSAPTQLDMVLREELHKSDPDGLIPSQTEAKEVQTGPQAPTLTASSISPCVSTGPP